MIMHKILFFSLFCLLTLPIGTNPALSNNFIILNLPESVAAKVISTILPIEINNRSRFIEGNITVTNITELQFTNNHLACRLHLQGKNMAFITEIMAQELRVNVGLLKTDLRVKAAIRFDVQQQIIFIRPRLEDISSNDTRDKDLVTALAPLLNGREFPVAVQKLSPFLAKTNDKIITINTKISNIEIKNKAIQISLIPIINTNDL